MIAHRFRRDKIDRVVSLLFLPGHPGLGRD